MLVEGYTVRVQIYQLQDVTRNQESESYAKRG